MNIFHRPAFDTQLVIDHYSKKDGVPIKYVCSSAFNKHSDIAGDIFYRDTPHPQFGNRYFALYHRFRDSSSDPVLMIANADNIENLEFEMLEIDGQLHYSKHVHDFFTIGSVSIDGGRSYLRLVGDARYPVKTLVVRNGEFEEKTSD